MGTYLGIFGGQGPNPAAALISDGVIVAFVEEERFTRIKNAPSALPFNSIMYCLRQAGKNLTDVDEIGFGWDCPHYAQTMPGYLQAVANRFPDFDNTYNKIHESRLIGNLDPLRIVYDLKFGLKKNSEQFSDEKLVFLKHHLCHAASAYYSSGFSESCILVLDGSGEEYTGGLYYGIGEDIECVQNFQVPNSLGGYYATFTEFLGFKSDSEEGKLMALASYGEYCQITQDLLDQVLSYDPVTGDFSLSIDFRFFGTRSYNSKFTDKLVSTFGEPRLAGQPINQHHKRLAYNVQWRLETIVKLLAKRIISEKQCSNICLAGGVAMNCKMNGAVALMEEVENIYVQPASSDNGVALGAAMLCSIAHNDIPLGRMKHCYLGPEYSNDEIASALDESKLNYYRSTDIVAEVAQLLADGKIIGWFQGRSEVGARALGGRSILANPLIWDMRDKVNSEVKHRESWRPFCPSLTEESYPKYFGDAPNSEFMILAFKLNEEFRNILPSAVHVDGTARPQSVSRIANPKFHSLLSQFGEISGHPVLINTSFNVQGEPIVNSPRDALRCFGGTGIDTLAIGEWIVQKSGVLQSGGK